MGLREKVSKGESLENNDNVRPFLRDLKMTMAKEQFDEIIEMIRQTAPESRMINEVEGDIWKLLLKKERLTL